MWPWEFYCTSYLFYSTGEFPFKEALRSAAPRGSSVDIQCLHKFLAFCALLQHFQLIDGVVSPHTIGKICRSHHSILWSFLGVPWIYNRNPVIFLNFLLRRLMLFSWSSPVIIFRSFLSCLSFLLQFWDLHPNERDQFNFVFLKEENKRYNKLIFLLIHCVIRNI